MKRKPSTAPVADSPWAVSILPSTSKRSPTPSASSTPSAADAPPVPAAVPTPEWSPAAAAPIEPSLVSAAPAQFAPPPQYAPPAQFAPPQFGPPAQYAPPAQFAPPPTQFGGPPAQFSPPPTQFGGPAQFGGPPQPYAYPPAPVPTSRSSVGIIVGVVAGVVLILVLIAVAIPVFLNQHKPANRNVVLPAKLVEQPQIHDANLDAASASVVAGLKQNPLGLSQVQSAYYGSVGDGTPLFMVAGGKLPTKPSAADIKAYFATSANTDAEQLVLNPSGSGPFGGSMECGHATFDGNLVNVCSSIDDAAAIVVMSSQLPTSQLAVLTRQIIGSVEH